MNFLQFLGGEILRNRLVCIRENVFVYIFDTSHRVSQPGLTGQVYTVRA